MTEQKLEPQHLCLCALFQTLTFLIERLIWRAGQSNGESRQVRKLDSRLGFAVAEFVQGCDCLCYERLLCSPFCKGRRIPGVHQNFPCLIKRSGSVNVIKKSCWQKGQRHPKRSFMRKFWTVNPKFKKKQKKQAKTVSKSKTTKLCNIFLSVHWNGINRNRFITQISIYNQSNMHLEGLKWIKWTSSFKAWKQANQCGGSQMCADSYQQERHLFLPVPARLYLLKPISLQAEKGNQMYSQAYYKMCISFMECCDSWCCLWLFLPGWREICVQNHSVSQELGHLCLLVHPFTSHHKYRVIWCKRLMEQLTGVTSHATCSTTGGDLHPFTL